MRKHPRSYPPDFRQKVVDLARTGRNLDELAHEFDLARQTVRNWVKQADLDAGARSDGRNRDLQVHRGLVQSAPPAYVDREYLTDEVRTGVLESDESSRLMSKLQ